MLGWSLDSPKVDANLMFGPRRFSAGYVVPFCLALESLETGDKRKHGMKFEMDGIFLCIEKMIPSFRKSTLGISNKEIDNSKYEFMQKDIACAQELQLGWLLLATVSHNRACVHTHQKINN